jgi:hypothetical protein
MVEGDCRDAVTQILQTRRESEGPSSGAQHADVADAEVVETQNP